MRKTQVMICSALFSVVALASTSAVYAEDEQNVAQQAEETTVQDANTTTSDGTTNGAAEQPSDPTVQSMADSADPYSVKSFFADFTHFAIGDTVPALYRTKKYEVTQWNVRNLPGPVAESHWTYMGGNYVMIANADGKILKVESGDIYYKH